MARSRGVRDFGTMMVQDHTKTTRGLQDAIRKSGRPVPPPPPLTGAQQGMLGQLKNAGRGFDFIYLQQQVQAHQEALGLMQTLRPHRRQPVHPRRRPLDRPPWSSTT